jgi:hypothetical protein
VPKKSQEAKPTEKPGYRVSQRDADALNKIFRGRNVPRILTSEAGISVDHPSKAVGFALVFEALGTSDCDFGQGILTQLATAAGAKQQVALDFLISAVKKIKPRDEVEIMLAAQMAIVHLISMESAHFVRHPKSLLHQERTADAK